MPVRRFRSLPVDDESVWMNPDDPRLWPTIKAVWELASRMCPPRFPPGVYKHRSMDEMNRQTEVWEQETIARQAKAVR